MLVDVHAHMTFPEFKPDFNKVIERAKAAGVISIITSGTSIQSNQEALELSKKFDIIKPSFGAYPTELNLKNIDEQLEFIKKHKKDIVAVGECGMDFKEAENFDEQKKCFEQVIELAEKINKPIIIHSRKAEKECLDLLESSKKKKVILHCFSANMKLVQRAYDLGYYFSIPTVITRLIHFQEVVKRVSIDRILTETDAPYLSPFQFKRNEPSFIVETIKKISEIKKLEKEEVEKLIFMNYKQIF